ncbi:hypothetical protein WMY93_008728 [Mugilogobius chulae]|uniref:Ig-like domain-containing protein n=1 Tax=Mugilogobius chulae TaxID=88201 RepID=A0AAW0P9R6_9GOBI
MREKEREEGADHERERGREKGIMERGKRGNWHERERRGRGKTEKERERMRGESVSAANADEQTELSHRKHMSASQNSTYCMKVSMHMTVEESDEGKCFSSKIRHLEKAEVSHSKMITCPDIEDYLAPYKQPNMAWYKECERVEFRSSIDMNNTHIWIPAVEEGDGGNYTCELQYGSRLVRRTTQLKVTGRSEDCTKHIA